VIVRLWWVGFLLSSLLSAQDSVVTHQRQTDACEQATTQAQLNACSAEQYQKTDERLNAVYQRLLGRLSTETSPNSSKDKSQTPNLEGATAKLKAAEAAWINYRDLHCEAAAQLYEGASIKPSMWSNCMRDVTEDRVREIKHAYENGDWKLE